MNILNNKQLQHLYLNKL